MKCVEELEYYPYLRSRDVNPINRLTDDSVVVRFTRRSADSALSVEIFLILTPVRG
jgi:hypothetical protein